MKQRNRFFLILLSLLLVGSFVSCGEFKAALEEDSVGTLGPNGQPALDDDPTNDFTVSLRLNGEAYVPPVTISVYWSDGYDVFIAPVDERGIATIDGLDGDYQVTLSSVPNGYAYDSNSYKATNFDRNIVIDLYDLNTVNGKGSALYGCCEISETGIYSVTITEPGEMIYFEFAPQTNGTYTVESWASITDDEINPIAVAYYGSSNYKHSPYTVEDVGAVGSFTRNFVHTVEIADQNISSGGGSQTFTFAVSAETKSGLYPVTYTFAVKRNGGFDLNGAKSTMIPLDHSDFDHFDFDAFNKMAGGVIIGAETLFRDENGKEKPGAYVFESSRYELWKVEDGGDGMYHVYDTVKYAANDGYGPVLVAYITSPCRFLDKAFTEIEAVGNKALTVNGTENYKQFIEGWSALASGGYYCVSDCPCHKDSVDPNRACPPGCPTCKSVCTPCPADMMGKSGYASYCNADGVAPVTEELAKFLQKFAISQRYFADGTGWAEQSGIHAYEDSQWLFACGYYK